MNVVVVTPVRGRHAHLRTQRAHLRAAHPDTVQIVVAMGDPDIAGVVGPDPFSEVLTVPVLDGPGGPSGGGPGGPASPQLPLALARNTGVRAALGAGADLVVLLDVDCVPDPGMLQAYTVAAQRLSGRSVLLNGPVTYLPAGAVLPSPGASWAGLRAPHTARPDPAPGTIQTGGSHDLFWSLNAALTPATWGLIGGFCEDYTGYGGEDTDFGRLARSAGVEMAWVGGADAYHQHHPVSAPPVEHLEAIVRNARLFHQRWGEWPMTGWLTAFRNQGLLTWEGTRLEVRPRSSAEDPGSARIGERREHGGQ